MITLNSSTIEAYTYGLDRPTWPAIKSLALSNLFDSIGNSSELLQLGPVAHAEAENAFQDNGTDIGASIVGGFINTSAGNANEQLVAYSLYTGADYFMACLPTNLVNVNAEAFALPDDQTKQYQYVTTATLIGFCLLQSKAYILRNRDYTPQLEEIVQRKEKLSPRSKAYKATLDEEHFMIDDLDNVIHRLTVSINQMNGTSQFHKLNGGAFAKILSQLIPDITPDEKENLEAYLNVPHRPHMGAQIARAQAEQFSKGITYN